jgi:phage baseplate assembly protein W
MSTLNTYKNIKTITSKNWQPKLGAIGEVVENIDDINQCIEIIITTPKGSDPHRPEFGSNIHEYIDYPVNEAIPNIIREAIDAILMWEPRVTVSGIQVEINVSQVTFYIEWVLKSSGNSYNVEVSL